MGEVEWALSNQLEVGNGAGGVGWGNCGCGWRSEVFPGRCFGWCNEEMCRVLNGGKIRIKDGVVGPTHRDGGERVEENLGILRCS